MSGQTELRVTMELLSDTIFGSGFSIPGGEDIAVCRDGDGWPYLKGSTFKGLLRESAENYLSWTGGSEDDLNALFGVPGWDGADDARRVHLTELTLRSRPATPDDCFSTRAFTAVEGGIVKDGTLRMAQAISSDLVFEGSIFCAHHDTELIKNALAGIKWCGTMRSRGFGRVRVRGEKIDSGHGGAGIAGASCLHYRLRTESPVLITDLSRSADNSMETRGYIPGSAVRGMVLGQLSADAPDWFGEHRLELLSEQTRFLDAVPIVGDTVPLPSIKGFYEGKEETGVIESVVPSGSFTPGHKRAKLGAFCGIDGDTIQYWSASTGGATRIGRGEHKMFQTRQLDAGQELEGYILLDNPELSERISACLDGTVWLGADRWGGFGRCAVTLLEAADAPHRPAAAAADGGKGVLYLLARSPISMRNDIGDPCGLNTAELARLLSVDSVTVERCATSATEYGGYNRTWQSRVPAAQYYDRGSVFRLRVSPPPLTEKLRLVESQGLGIRRAEGFGQVLFLSEEQFESISRKQAPERTPDTRTAAAVKLRQARFRWVRKNADRIRSGALSASQIGTIQSLCEKALAKEGDLTELRTFFEKNLRQRGAKHGARFVRIEELVNEVLNSPLPQLLETPCSDSTEEKLRLLILLFDYSRKESERV